MTLFKGIMVCKTKAEYDSITEKDPDILYLVEGEEIKIYSSTGQNTDGAMTQKAVTDALGGKADLVDIPTALSEMTDDSTHRVVSDTEKSSWNGKQDVLSDGQLLAINSGITASKVAQIVTNQSDIGVLAGLYNSLDARCTGLSNSKQNNLSTAQMDAVNSGIDSTKITTYDGYAALIAAKADASALADKVSKSGDTMTGDLTIGSSVQLHASDGGIEAQYLDFHYGGGFASDYTMRMWPDDDHSITFTGGRGIGSVCIGRDVEGGYITLSGASGNNWWHLDCLNGEFRVVRNGESVPFNIGANGDTYIDKVYQDDYLDPAENSSRDATTAWVRERLNDTAWICTYSAPANPTQYTGVAFNGTLDATTYYGGNISDGTELRIVCIDTRGGSEFTLFFHFSYGYGYSTAVHISTYDMFGSSTPYLVAFTISNSPQVSGSIKACAVRGSGSWYNETGGNWRIVRIYRRYGT